MRDSVMPAGTPAPKSADALAALAQLNMGRVLRPLANLATLISAYLHARQFFFPNFGLRASPDEAYVVILVAYAGHRELRRWSKDPRVISDRARRGEYFVVGWWTAYFIAVLIANHTLRYQVPEGLESLCMQITAVFFGTLASQHIFKGRVRGRDLPGHGTDGSGGIAENGQGRPLEDRILDYLKNTTGPVSSSVLEEAMDVSRSTILRAMARLEKERRVRWAGRSDNDPAGGFELRQP